MDPSILKVASILITGILGVLAWTLQHMLREGRARLVAVRATLVGVVTGTVIALLSHHVEGVQREDARIDDARKERQILEHQQTLLEQVVRTTYRFSDVGVDLLQFDLDLQSSGLRDLGVKIEERLQSCARANPRPNVKPFSAKGCRDFDSGGLWPAGFIGYEVKSSSNLLIAGTEPVDTLLRELEIRIRLFLPGGNDPEIELLTARPRDIRYTFLSAISGPDRLRVAFKDLEVRSRRDGSKIRSVVDLGGSGVRADLAQITSPWILSLPSFLISDSGLLTLRFDSHPLTIRAGPRPPGAPRELLVAGTISSQAF